MYRSKAWCWLMIVIVLVLVSGCSRGSSRRRVRDVSPPVVSRTDFISAGEVSGGLVMLGLAAEDNVSVTAYFVSENSDIPDLGDGGWVPVVPAAVVSLDADFELSPGKTDEQVERRLYLWLRDGAGNISDMASDSVIILPSDVSAPTINSTNFIDSGVDTAASLVVSLLLSAEDDNAVAAYIASEYSAVPLLSDSGWVAIAPVALFESSVPFILDTAVPGVPESREVFVWFRDKAGNISGAASDTVILSLPDTYDLTEPENNSGDFISSGGTNSANVTLNISASDNAGIAGYYISEGSGAPGPNSSGWVPVSPATDFSAEVVYELAGIPSGTAPVTPTIWFIDVNGNISEPVSDTVRVSIGDTVPPVNMSSGFINSGAASTEDPVVQITLSATDDAGVTAYLITETSAAPGMSDPQWVSVTSATVYSDTAAFELSPAAAGFTVTRYLYVWFRDAAGNMSEQASDSIQLVNNDIPNPDLPDGQAPVSSGSNFIEQGSAQSDSPILTLEISASDNTGVTAWFISESDQTPSLSASGWVETSPAGTSVDISATYTIQTYIQPGSQAEITIYVWFRDAAGNISSALGDSIIVAGNNTTSVAAGFRHTLAVTGEGTVWAWGDNGSGQLGAVEPDYIALPALVSGITGAVSVAGGGLAGSIALKDDGTVWTWGSNLYGQLGDGTTTDRPAPAQVSGTTGVTRVAGGEHHFIILKSDGTVWGWGRNDYGQLGNGTTVPASTPVQVLISDVSDITAKGNHAAALKNDGTVWTWGYNLFGQLGNGTKETGYAPAPVAGLNEVTAIGTGRNHTLAVKSDGTVWAWGDNLKGQIGNGTTDDALSPVQVQNLSGVTAVSAGEYHSLALKDDGTVSAWGYNFFGQLGNSSKTDTSTPVNVNNLSDVTDIDSGWWHNIALKNDGTIWTWGNNDKGNLGNNSRIASSTPVRAGL